MLNRNYQPKFLSVWLLGAVSILLSVLVRADESAVRPAIDGQQLGCLAMNIYHEGRGESPRGRVAIAAVTQNRVNSKHYPNTICEVVWQPKQFSWTRLSDEHLLIRDEKSWRDALLVARLFLTGARESTVGDATHYHSISVQPYWIADSRLIARVGDHMFYLL